MLPELERWSGVLNARRAAYERYLDSWEKRVGAFLELRPEAPAVIAGANGALAGVPFAVKDNIAVEGFGLTCGSRMLEGFRSPYSATCVRALLDAGAAVIGKTNLDQFGMGSSTETSAYKRTSNPWDSGRVPGGSSGGSAAAVAAGMVPFALGTDTGGSVRQPASFCGVYGLKPTYGAVSRFGLVAYASSLETPGIIAPSVDIVETVFEAMKGEDPMDQSSVGAPANRAETAAVGAPANRAETAAIGAPANRTEAGDGVSRVAVLRGLAGLEPEVEAAYRRAVAALESRGIEIAEVDMPTLEYVVPSYYVIATAEASANLARFTGIAYGRRSALADTSEGLIRLSRSEGFGEEVKLRILLGTYVLRSGFQSRYYVRAQRVRTAIRQDFSRIFDLAPLLLMPVFPVRAFAPGDPAMDPFKQKLADKFTCAANLAGLPALAFPTGSAGGLPLGLQFIAPAFREKALFSAGRAMAASFPLERPSGYSEEFLT